MIAYEYQHQPNAHFDPDMEYIRSSRYLSNHVVPGKNRDHKFKMVYISLSSLVPNSCSQGSYHDLIWVSNNVS